MGRKKEPAALYDVFADGWHLGEHATLSDARFDARQLTFRQFFASNVRNKKTGEVVAVFYCGDEEPTDPVERVR